MANKKNAKPLRVEVAPTSSNKLGCLAEVVPGVSIRIVGWEWNHDKSRLDAAGLALLDQLEGVPSYRSNARPGDPAAAPVFRDYLEERGLLEVKFDRTFKVGDEVEYDSYNLTYTNPILRITRTFVSTQEHYQRRADGSPKEKQMKLEEFCWRNGNLDLAAVARHNDETSRHI